MVRGTDAVATVWGVQERNHDPDNFEHWGATAQADSVTKKYKVAKEELSLLLLVLVIPAAPLLGISALVSCMVSQYNCSSPHRKHPHVYTSHAYGLCNVQQAAITLYREQGNFGVIVLQKHLHLPFRSPNAFSCVVFSECNNRYVGAT